MLCFQIPLLIQLKIQFILHLKLTQNAVLLTISIVPSSSELPSSLSWIRTIVFYDYYNKWPQIWWLRIAENYFLTVLEVLGPIPISLSQNQGIGGATLPLELRGAIHILTFLFLCHFQQLQLHSLWSLAHGLFLCLQSQCYNIFCR